MLNYPTFESLTNWIFAVALPAYTVDANALVVVLPRTWDTQPNELVEPVAEIIPSERVIDYRSGSYAVYRNLETCLFEVSDDKGNTYTQEGSVITIIDQQSVRVYQQAGNDVGYTLVSENIHGLDYLPVTQTRGLVRDRKRNRYIYESRLADMVPELNEAVREYSDLQAEVVTNVYSERWEYNNNECKTCKGSGQENIKYGYCGECRKCGGTGVNKRGPYTQITVKPDPITNTVSAPIPPAGYIQKATNIVELQDTRVFNHLYAALAAINMQFLAQVPLNISGEAKSVDRDALNTFVHSIAEDLVAIMDSVCRYTIDMRYGLLVQDPGKRAQMRPVIAVPENFDILSADYLLKELKEAQDSKVSPVIIDALQMEYANKKFNADPQVQRRLELTIKLDPLSGVTEDDKLARLSARGITQETYIISSNIREYIDRALEEHGEKFLTMRTPDQKNILRGYAAETVPAPRIPEPGNNPGNEF